MSGKKNLKEAKFVEQGGKDALNSKKRLPAKIELFDTHRKKPKKDGGTYNDSSNVLVTNPREHMKEHGTLRVRTKEIEDLKTMVDSRMQISKMYYGFCNRILAYKRRTDHMDPETLKWLEESSVEVKNKLKDKDKEIAKAVKSINHPFAKAALGVKGVGPMSIAFMMVYIKIEEADYASSFWKYVGFDKASHERYSKGEAGGGNKTLRTALYTLAESQIKTRGAYREVYDNEKAKLAASKKMTKTRNTQGKLIDAMWCDTKAGHRHGAAIRKMLKHFLADAWKVWRTIEGLDTPHLYVQEKMGHTHIVQPESRGWVYEKLK